MSIGPVRVLSFALVFWTNPAWPQMVLDGTVGSSGPLTGPDFQITAALGRQAGPNLFHSFSQFNVLQGESATFSGPPEVQNILTRVTGGSASMINGPLNSRIDGASLFLLNPAGIMFGPAAEVNISGSFTASTASSILLGKDGEFNATLPSASSLTIAPPSAFGFAQPSPAPIQIVGAQLRVGDLNGDSPAADLSLVGGDIDMQGGAIFSGGGQINLVSVQSAGEISAVPGLNELERGGRIDLREGASVGGTGGSDTVVRAGDLSVSDFAALSRDSSQTAGGGIDIALKGTLTVAGAGRIRVSADSGKGGDIQIQASRVTITGELGQDGTSAISTDAFGAGRGRDISIRTGHLTVESSATIQTSGFLADAGDIEIRAGSARVSDADGTGPGVRSDGFDGKAGNISMAVDTLELFNGGAVATAVESGAAGSGASIPPGPIDGGGNINVKAEQFISVKEGSISTVSDVGAGGSIRLIANSFIYADSAFFGIAGGALDADLRMEAPLVFVQDSSLDASSAPPGGRILIDACLLNLDGTTLGATAGVFTEVNCTDPFTVGNWPNGSPLSWPPTEPEDWPASELGAFLPDIWERAPLARACGLKFELNSFIVRGRGGVALAPEGWQPSVSLPPAGGAGRN